VAPARPSPSGTRPAASEREGPLGSGAFAKWSARAAGVPPSLPRAPIPVLVGEAIALSCFLEEQWEPVVGASPRPGLRLAAESGGLSATAIGDLRELAIAVAQAQARLDVLDVPVPEPPVARAQAVVSEIRQAPRYLFEAHDERDHLASYARLDEARHETSTHDGLALFLEGFALFANRFRDRLALLPGFDLAVLDEAIALGARLREQSGLVMHRPAPAAREARNRLLTLLFAQVADARRAVRFIFRSHPDVAQLAASDYNRQRRARSRGTAREDPSPAPGAPPGAGGGADQ